MVTNQWSSSGNQRVPIDQQKNSHMQILWMTIQLSFVCCLFSISFVIFLMSISTFRSDGKRGAYKIHLRFELYCERGFVNNMYIIWWMTFNFPTDMQKHCNQLKAEQRNVKLVKIYPQITLKRLWQWVHIDDNNSWGPLCITWVKWPKVNVSWSVPFRIVFTINILDPKITKYLKAASQNLIRHNTCCASEEDTCI